MDFSRNLTHFYSLYRLMMFIAWCLVRHYRLAYCGPIKARVFFPKWYSKVQGADNRHFVRLGGTIWRSTGCIYSHGNTCPIQSNDSRGSKDSWPIDKIGKYPLKHIKSKQALAISFDIRVHRSGAHIKPKDLGAKDSFLKHIEKCNCHCCCTFFSVASVHVFFQ